MGKRWALVLSGGGTHGAAHLGAWQVLARAGLRPDWVIGVSAGALAGAMIASEVSVDQMLALALGVSRRDFRIRWGHVLARTLGWERPGPLFEVTPLTQRIRSLVGNRRVMETPIPFLTVTVDLTTGEALVIGRTDQIPVAAVQTWATTRRTRLADWPLDLVEAAWASSAVPGLFGPVVLTPPGSKQGHWFVDGGAADNVPLDLAEAVGAEAILVVNVAGSAVAFPTERQRWWSSIPDTVWFMLDLMTRLRAQRPAAVPTVVIRPHVGLFPQADLGSIADLIHAGGTAMAQALPRWRTLIQASEEGSA